MAAAERAAEEAATKLNASILARYHEEQIWSDKIRRMSTWGTWGLMGVNVLLFLVFQIGVEPWRRKRLVKGFEEKVVEALEKENATYRDREEVVKVVPASSKQTVADASGEVDVAPVAKAENTTADTLLNFDPFVSEASSTKAEPVQPAFLEEPLYEEGSKRKGWSGFYSSNKAKVHDLFSEASVTVRRVDLTAKAIEGFVGGIVLASLVGALLRGK